MLTFNINSADIQSRLDPHFYSPTFLQNIKSLNNVKVIPLDELVEFSNESWNQKDFFDDLFPYIEISEIDLDIGSIKDIAYISKSEAPSRAKKIVRENDIIVSTTRPHRGAIALIDSSKDGFIASTGFAVLRKLKTNFISKKYLFYALRLNQTLNQFMQRSSGGNYPAITEDEMKKVLIPVPSKTILEKIVQLMDEAYEKKRRNEEEAEKLLNNYDELIYNHTNIVLDVTSQEKTFIININDLEGALNPERYSKKIIFDKNFSWCKIKDKGVIIRDTFTPKKTYPEQEFDLIRIDDLDNNPQEAVIRQMKGKNINGIIARVKEGDILVARLAPTIENKKTIIVPFSDNELIASTEFICFRCNRDINPIFMYVMLKTDFYKNLMLQKSRGATPSRRRLSHEDFANLPFPQIDIDIQNKIASIFLKNIKRANFLLIESRGKILDAKQEVEKILFK